MTIYQEEMQRKAYRYGCTTAHDEATDLMAIIHHGQQIAEISAKGFMYYDTTKISDEESREVFEKLQDESPLVREYVGLYESAQPMRATGVSEYRQIAEYGDIVFGAMYSPKHGFMFSSWSQSKDKTSVTLGDYSPDYLANYIQSESGRVVTICVAVALIAYVSVVDMLTDDKKTKSKNANKGEFGS